MSTLSLVEFLEPPGRGRPGRTPGSIDYRFTRNRVLRSFRSGEITESEICDAQRELVRVAIGASVPAREPCPVCERDTLRIVRFVFGPRLPSGGRAVTSDLELRRLARRAGEHRCYVVEVCPECRWNHLRSSMPLGVERSA